jgi:hypothetical protein
MIPTQLLPNPASARHVPFQPAANLSARLAGKDVTRIDISEIESWNKVLQEKHATIQINRAHAKQLSDRMMKAAYVGGVAFVYFFISAALFPGVGPRDALMLAAATFTVICLFISHYKADQYKFELREVVECRKIFLNTQDFMHERLKANVNLKYSRQEITYRELVESIKTMDTKDADYEML